MTARNSRPLSATQAADKLSQLLSTRDERIMSAMFEAQNKAELSVRESDKAAVSRIMSRVAEHEKEKVARVLLALGCDLSGFELQAGNDVDAERTEMPPALEHPANKLAREAIEREVPQALRTPVPPLRPGERQTVERK